MHVLEVVGALVMAEGFGAVPVSIKVKVTVDKVVEGGMNVFEDEY